ncbi:MAG: hypothetical protein NVS3B5_23970 [Sphingomicrobium sp.]
MSESNVTFSEAEALDFHSRGRPGKIEIIASKPMATQRDLALAYSPGVGTPRARWHNNDTGDPVAGRPRIAARGAGHPGLP